MKFVCLTILILFCGCSGVKYHLNQAEKHLNKAKMLGAVITPDTVWKDRPVFIPSQDVAVKANPVLDSAQFEIVIGRYDSLLKKTAGLIFPEELITANKEIRRLKGRIIKGFSKDSTYHIPVDSVTDIKIIIKDGLLDSAGIQRKPTTVIASVPVAVFNEIKCEAWPWWYLLIAVFVGMGIGVLLFALKR